MLGACTTGPDGDAGTTGPAGPSSAAGAPSRAAEGGPSPGADGGPSHQGPAAPADPALAAYYGQELRWRPCDTQECANLIVPVDYAHPDGRTARIAVRRAGATSPVRSTSPARDALVVNPGGPGTSGVEMAARAGRFFSRELRAHYDIVGFDPRGVGDSSPVWCPSPANLGVPDLDLTTAAGRDTALTKAEHFADACAAMTGPLLTHVGTADVARDLDVLRAALGQERLDFYGASYGTYLGALYAEAFPSRVGRMVLDAVVDPAMSMGDLTRAHARDFEEVLRGVVGLCQAAAGCPLTGTVDDGVAQVNAMVAEANRTPVPTADGRGLTGRQAVLAAASLAQENDGMLELVRGLDQILTHDDGTVLRAHLDGLMVRGTHAETMRAGVFGAVLCADFPSDDDPDRLAGEAAALTELSPSFGPLLVYGEVGCARWPRDEAARRHPVSAAGAGPVLLVAATGDRVTPYAWARALDDQLASSRLLTVGGGRHVSYRPGAPCVSDVVDAYLLDGVLPPVGATCP